MFISRSKTGRDLECEGKFHQQFTAVAPFYDDLMKSVPYAMWVDYVELLLSLEEASPKRVVDLACGTGNVTFEFARRGYRAVGVDISQEMIEAASRKSRELSDLPAGFQCQDLRTLSLPEEFDLAVCLFDSLNYILWAEELEAALRNIARTLLPDGLFIFDMNSEYALEAELFTQDNLFRDSDLRYNWISHFDPKLRVSEVEMFFEVRNGDGKPIRFKEMHRERAYSMEEILALLDQTGWNCRKTYDAYTTSRPRLRSERWFFVCSRKEE